MEHVLYILQPSDLGGSKLGAFMHSALAEDHSVPGPTRIDWGHLHEKNENACSHEAHILVKRQATDSGFGK